MNLFVLDRLPILAAQQNNDAHVRKIILEATQMLGYAFDEGTFIPWPWMVHEGPYFNHPMSRWVRRSKQNYDWTLQHAYALCDEFAYRFNKTKHHKCREYLDWISLNLPLHNLSNIGQTDWPRCFGKWREVVGTTSDAVYDYRRYYKLAKRHLANWTKRPIPDWYS